MSETAAVGAEPPAAGLGLPARVWGVLTSPRATFADVAARPRWLGMLVLVLLVTVICTGGFMATSVGKQAFLDQQVRTQESFGRQVTDETYAQLEKVAGYAAPLAVGQIVILRPIMYLIIAGILYAVFSAALGGGAAFKQVFAVVVYSGAVTLVQQLFVTPLNYVRESMSSATNVAVFLPMLEEGTFVARLLGTIDLFLVWWVFVLSIGLAVLFRRKTGPIAAGLFAVYGIIAIIIAAVTSGRAGA
jgi:hypothetical protein